MTKTEEKQMLRDINRIARALESISKLIKTSMDVIMDEPEEPDEGQRLYSKNIEFSEKTRE